MAVIGYIRLRLGEGWGEGLKSIDRSDPPHPNPLPCGEREHTEFAALSSIQAQTLAVVAAAIKNAL